MGKISAVESTHYDGGEEGGIMEDEQQEFAEDDDDDDGVNENSGTEGGRETPALILPSSQTTIPPFPFTNRPLLP